MRWFLLSLALIVGVAQSQDAPKQQAKARKQPSSADKRGTEQSPFVIKGSITTKAEEKTADDKNAEQQKQDTDRWVMRFTGLAALFTLFLVVITGTLARYTYKLWTSTHELVQGAEKTANSQLRAYVSSSPDYIFNFSSAVLAQMRYTTVNHGLTPARKFKKSAMVEIFPHPLPADFDFPELPVPREETYALQPRQSIHTTITAARLFSEDEIRHATINENSRIYCFGIVTYVDVFGHDHTTKFCSSVVGGNDLLAIGTTGLSRPVVSGGVILR